MIPANPFNRPLGRAVLLPAILVSFLTPAVSQGPEGESTTATHLFVKRGTAEKHEPSATSVSRIMLTADQTNGRYSIIDDVFKPGMKTPPHKHAYHSETFLVLAGRMKWTVGGETDIIGPGDLVYIPPDTSHATEVLGDEPVHAIMLYEPGGYEIGLRQRAAARSARESGDPEAVQPRGRRSPNPYADFVPTAPRRPRAPSADR